MIKRFIPLVLLLSACGAAETTPFCECMMASEKLNDAQVSAQTGIIDAEEEITDVDTKSLKALMDAKKKACADFETIGAEEAAELKKACEENED